MKNKRLFEVLSFGLLILMTACQSMGQPFHAEMSKPGDTINGLGLSTGAEAALPLWAFCSSSQENNPIQTFNCRAPAAKTLAIGHVFLLADGTWTNMNWSDLVWELSIDNQMVDLESFGKFEYVMPTIHKSPSRVGEVFKRVTAWNIVMTNLNPGEHTLSFRAHSEKASHMWIVNLVIEETKESDISAAPFPLHS